MDLQINNSAFEIQVLSTLAIKCRGDFNIFQFASATRRQKTAEDSTDTFVYYVCNGLGMPRHFAKGFDLIFKQLRLLVLLNYIVYL